MAFRISGRICAGLFCRSAAAYPPLAASAAGVPVFRSLEACTGSYVNLLQSFDVCASNSEQLLERALQAEARAKELVDLSGDDALNLGEKLLKPGSKEFNQHVVLAVCCVVTAALAAGLTMGLVSIDPMEMEIIVSTNEKDMSSEADIERLKEDKRAAASILPLLKDQHRLLVTLLLMNSLSNEALPLFLDDLVPSWLAVVISVTLVLVFGEIIPSAVFTGADQLQISAKFSRLVRLVRFLLAPIAVPIAKLLDCILGKNHKGRYNFAELRAIVNIHSRLGNAVADGAIIKCFDQQSLGYITITKEHGLQHDSVVVFTDGCGVKAKSSVLRSDGTPYYVKPVPPLSGRDLHDTVQLYSNERRDPQDLIVFKPGDVLTGVLKLQERDEIKIMHGVMELTHMTASEAIVPLSETWMLDSQRVLTMDTLTEILSTGYSRIPVYDRFKHNIRGFLLVKKMIVIHPDAGNKVEDIQIERLVVVKPSLPMLDLLNKFQEQQCHLALVTNEPEVVVEAWESNTEIPPDVHMVGIISLEDVIEKLLQEEIYDEVDKQGPGEIFANPLPIRRMSSSDIRRSRDSLQGKSNSRSKLFRINSLSTPLLTDFAVEEAV